jgi:aryl-alcohol dehydrogenase-like predicted oxidoreductase
MIPTLLVAGSNVSITRVGFGCARIFGGNEFRTSARLIEAALAANIRHFDSAPFYGSGLCEAVLGTVLMGIRDITITTKIGIHRPDQVGGKYSGPVLYRRFVRPVMSRFPRTKARLLRLIERHGNAVAVSDHRRRLSREEVLRGLEESLRYLRRNFVDLYLIHEPDQFELTDEVKELFATLKLNGTIGAFGLAWGRAADTDAGFGTVVQGRYANNLPTYGKGGETRILHGVLRHYLSESSAHSEDAGTRIRNVLDAHPDTAIIFSASTPFQIDRIVRQLR